MMSSRTSKSITLAGVRKAWGETVSLRDVDLEIPTGKFTAILGPSGCGKSTMLRVISGLEELTAGRVLMDDEDITTLPPSRRHLSMVFQNYALFPHLSVEENIVFGLKVERLPKAERQARLAEVAELLEITPYLQRKPSALSGGQQQRVALGRAVISRRPVCLMDEPLSNLDARLRDEMRREIRRLQKTLGFTMVYVTHDQTEAITMADRVVLMNEGRIEQVATPEETYTRPATPFAARFIGSPPMNLLPAKVFTKHTKSLLQSLVVGVRPEVLSISTHGNLTAQITSAEFLGADTLVELEADEHSLLAKLPGNHRFTEGEQLQLAVPQEHIHLFDSNTGKRIEDSELASLFAESTA